MNIQFEKNKPKEMLVLVVLIVFFLLVNLFSFSKLVRIPLETVYQPISFWGAKWGSGILADIRLLKDITKIKDENDANKLKVEELENENLGYTLLLEKYNSLLAQNKYASKKYTYISAEIFKSNGEYILNVGNRDGVKIGDVVVFGNSYIGKVSLVDENYSRLNIPSEIGNSISVTIVTSVATNFTADQLTQNALSSLGKAIAVGNEYEIKIENLPSISKAKEGDIVLINDSKVGQYLILGTLAGVQKDKADALLSAVVAPVVNIENLKFVYVRK
jgi:cell shape-determining protein MreC